jgi:hypothetical protein
MDWGTDFSEFLPGNLRQSQREREQRGARGIAHAHIGAEETCPANVDSSEVDRLYEELAGKEIEMEDIKQQLKALQAAAQQQLAQAADDISTMRSTLAREQARASQVMMKRQLCFV